jgi:hypothetical protein
MAELPSFRLYVIGRLAKDQPQQSLTAFAEYRTARALSRIEIQGARLQSLLEQIGNLRSFVEAGAPEFEKIALKRLGQDLLEILLVGKTRDLFFTATGERQERQLLPLEVIAEDPEVAGWPWEYLYDPAADAFISQEFHPISRSIFTSTKPSLCGPVDGKVRLLIILGVPPDDSDTMPKEEVKYISDVFSSQLDDERFEITVLNAEDYQQLISYLTTRQFEIVHYFGHAGFNYEEGEGYLSIKRPGKDKFHMPANMFARLLRDRGIRLVFLNACKTAIGALTENPGRSSIAAALLDRGIPAVIATQFSLPESSAHFLAATIYNTLLTGKPIGDAIRDGRNAMGFSDSAQFFDWGIPVLYSTIHTQIILPSIQAEPRWAKSYVNALDTGNLVESLATTRVRGAPSILDERTRSDGKGAKCRVALIDIDSKVGFLPDLAQSANEAQDYYYFEVVYLPVPSGYARHDINVETQTYLPRLTSVLDATPKSLDVDFACCLTGNMVATKEDDVTWSNLFAATLPDNDRVVVVSTFRMREYAREAGRPFAKSVLIVCLSMLVEADPRWAIKRHEKTYGCLFDFCGNRDDIVVGLRKMRFDHEVCRKKIKDKGQLKAIDALASL